MREHFSGGDLKIDDGDGSHPTTPLEARKQEEIYTGSRGVNDAGGQATTQKKVDKFGMYLLAPFVIYIHFWRLWSWIEDRILSPLESGYYTAGKDFVSSEGSTLESTVRKMADEASSVIDGKAIEENVRVFEDGSRVLIKALDEVALIHPFIAGEQA